MNEKMKLYCCAEMILQEKNRGGGVNERSLSFSRPHDRKPAFLSCGLFVC